MSVKTFGKRSLLGLLTAALLLSLLPWVTPAAQAADAWDGTVDISWYDPNASTYEISTPAQLAGLAALVNGITAPDCPKVVGDTSLLRYTVKEDAALVGAAGGGVTDRVYVSSTDFSYKTVYLTADLDMGGRQSASGEWSGPNWTPIGGAYALDSNAMSGDSLVLSSHFNGVLDGQGHSIKNLYCNRFTQRGFAYSQSIGLVGCLGGDPGCGASANAQPLENGWQPTVRNLLLESGSVYGRRRVGGIVGAIGSTTNGVIIENCANRAQVRNTDAKGLGGIAGYGGGKGTIRSCYNAGAITTTYTCPTGGILGSNCGVDIYNCYNVGTISSNGNLRGRGIGGHDSGSYTVSNCYYLQGCDDDPASQGWYKGSTRQITIDITALSASAMRQSGFLDRLNAAGKVFLPDTAGINNGYPILYFQSANATSAGQVTISQPTGGKISADFTGTVPAGRTVTLSAQANPGYVLQYYTVNGTRLSANFFTVSGNCVVSAVFAPVRQVSLQLPDTDDSFSYAVTRTGYKLVNGKTVSVTDEPVDKNSTLLEGNVLTVHTAPWKDALPEDVNACYTDSFTVSASNTTKNSDGSFTVTGAGTVALSISRAQAKKSWLSLADTRWYTGKQTSYTIQTPEELAGLAWLVNVNGLSFQGITIHLGKDISLANNDGTAGLRLWEGIGRSLSRPFAGTFDGGGHSIRDLTIRQDGSYAALFGFCSKAQIRDLTVLGSVESNAASSYAAGIAAYVSGGSLTNCVSYAAVTAKGVGAGGVAAYLCDGATVKGCTNRGTVSGASGVGGIAAISYSPADRIENCVNYGAISAAGDNVNGVGGIAGRLAGSVIRCTNAGSITSADRYTGGLVGYATTRSGSVLQDSLNSGALSLSSRNANAAAGGLVGYGQYLTWDNCKNIGALHPGGGFPSANCNGEIGRSGSVTRGNTTDESLFLAPSEDPLTPETPDPGPFQAVFMADGAVVQTVRFQAGAKSISAPTVPAKAGYTGRWAPYTLGNQNIVIQAVYRQNTVRGGDSITKSGSYAITPFSSGQLSIAGGLQVTLDGSNGSCRNLTISVGAGTTLTLRDVTISGDDTALILSGGTLRLEGRSQLLSTNTAETNIPAVLLRGDVQIEGSGQLQVTGGTNSCAIRLESGHTLRINGGKLCVDSTTDAGEDISAIQAAGGTVVLGGGVVSGGTACRNTPVITASSVTVSGGTHYLQSKNAPYAILADRLTLQGGGVLAQGRLNNQNISGTQALSGVTGSAQSQLLAPLPFQDLYAGDAAFEAIYQTVQRRYFNGMSATEFSPEVSMTRSMFVVVLYRMAGSPGVSGTLPFTDTPGQWYRNAILWAVQNGITTGTSATEFSPEEAVSVEQLAAFLFRFSTMLGLSSTADLPATAGATWSSGYASWALDHGLILSPDGLTADAPRSLLASAAYAFDQTVRH